MNTAERIYEAVARDGATTALRAELLARRIEEDIASNHPCVGDSLGSVRALADRYGAGRSTVCEAIRILERRGLGRMRPGRSGGLILAKPSLANVAEELADYFRQAKVGLEELLEAREAVDGAAARVAADRRPGGPDLARLADAAGTRDALVRDLAVRSEVAKLAGDPAILLFVECLNSLTLDLAGQAPDTRHRDRLDGGWPVRLGAALANGDGAGAAETICASLASLRPLLAGSPGLGSRPRPGAVGELRPNRSSEVACAIATDMARLSGAGARLGSEWELCERYGVGRLILRQAIRILEDRGVVECRRGRGQGLVARGPQPFGAIRQAVAWLMSEGLDPMQVGALLCLLNVAAPVHAVVRAGPAQRRRLERLLKKALAARSLHRSDWLNLVRCVSELAGEHVLDIFCRCLVAYEARFRKDLPDTFDADCQRPYLDNLSRLLAVECWTAEALSAARAETAALMLWGRLCSAP